MTYTRIGSCNQCGVCCKKLIPYPLMTDSWPDKICRFLKQVSVDKYICEITNSLFSDSAVVKIGNRVRRDNDGNLIQVTQAHYDYWLNECRPFPNPLDPAHTPDRKFNLPVECGFKIVKV